MQHEVLSNILSWKWYPLMPVACFSRIMHPTTKEIWSSNSLRSTRWLGLQIPNSQSGICRMCWTYKSDSWRPHLATSYRKNKDSQTFSIYLYRNCLLLHLLNPPLGIHMDLEIAVKTVICVFRQFFDRHHWLEKTRSTKKPQKTARIIHELSQNTLCLISWNLSRRSEVFEVSGQAPGKWGGREIESRWESQGGNRSVKKVQDGGVASRGTPRMRREASFLCWKGCDFVSNKSNNGC